MPRRFRATAALLMALAAGGCGVQFVSPYSDEVARRAARLHDEVVAFELAMRRQAGTRAGDPRAEANQKRFDDWRATVDTMAVVSATLDPRAVRCQAVLTRLGGSPGQMDPAVAQSLREQEGDAALRETDCQTYGVVRLGQRLDQLRRLYEEQCRVPGLADAAFLDAAPRPAAAPAGPVRLAGCEALWSPLPAAALGLTGPHGLAVDPVLRSIRAVIVVQEGKRGGA